MNFEFRQQPIKLTSIVLAILVSFFVGSLVILYAGHNPLHVYYTMLKGALGSRFAVASTLRWTTPLLFTSIGAAFSFRAGLFNMGVEGQMYIGAFVSALTGHYMGHLPAVILIPLCLLAGAAGGMLWAVLPATIRVNFGASEMVMTMMLNFVAFNLTDYLTRYHFLSSGIQGHSLLTEAISPNAAFHKIWSEGSAHYGIFVGLVCFAVFWLIMNKTTFGYEIHMTGINPHFARYGGINVKSVHLRVMLITGAIGGLGGATEVMGVIGRFMSGFSPDFGFDGIVAALLGNHNPVGVFFSSFFLGIVKSGSLQVERATSVSRSIAMIIQGLMVTFISCSYLSRMDFFKKIRKKSSHLCKRIIKQKWRGD